MKLTKEFKIGFIVTTGIAIALFGLNYLKGSSLLNKERKFFAIYNNIEGLNVSNPITINGFKVGRVSRIELLDDNSGRLMVSLAISDAKVPITKSTVATIISSDLLGSKAVDISIENSGIAAVDGDTLVASVQESITKVVGDQIEPLKAKFVTLMNSLDSVVGSINQVLNPNAVGDINKSFYSISETLGNLREISDGLNTLVSTQQENIGAVIQNMEVFTGTLAKSSTNIEALTTNLAKVSDSLAAVDFNTMVSNLDKTVNQLSGLATELNEGKGSLGMLLKSDSLHNQMVSTTKELENLFEDIQAHPGRYVNVNVFGGKQKGLMLNKAQEEKLKKILDNTKIQ